MAHSLVPPTPGPLFVAGELSVSIGLMILGGIVVGVFTVTSGYAYALWANRRWPISLRDSTDISTADLEALSSKDERELPSFWLSVLPIILPVVLIAGKTIMGSFFKASSSDEPSHILGGLFALFDYLGNPNIALALSAAIALGTLAFHQRADRKKIATFVQNALSSGGVSILITAAGGAFGGILQQTGIGHRIQELASSHQLAVLPLAFFVTAVVRTAQGSATVAMITAIGIMGGFANASQLGFHPLYLALAIGCGSKPIAWMNDSGFWVISKMSGMTESETLRLSSAMMVVMAVVGLVVVMIFARLLPLV
jgi:GntP family gluconate:H+ symporter